MWNGRYPAIAEALGVEIYPGFAARDLIFDALSREELATIVGLQVELLARRLVERAHDENIARTVAGATLAELRS